MMKKWVGLSIPSALLPFLFMPPTSQIGRRRNYINLYFRPFFRPFPNLWTRYFDNNWTDFHLHRHKWSTRQLRRSNVKVILDQNRSQTQARKTIEKTDLRRRTAWTSVRRHVGSWRLSCTCRTCPTWFSVSRGWTRSSPRWWCTGRSAQSPCR